MRIQECLDPQTLQHLLNQALTAEQSQAAEQHIDQCANCQRELERMAGGQHWWSDAANLLSTSDGLATLSVNDATDPSEHHRAKVATLKQVRQILQSPSHPEMLGRLDGYEIESFLGQGGFGVVFKAHDSELNRPVAIKVLAPHLASSGVARRRFAREAQAAAAVVHPNVVPIHAVQSEVDFPYLVMSYVPGCSLQTFVQEHGPLDSKSIIRIASQVAAGLAAAHRQGLVHRDIKPANILLENGLSRALITDFGLARAADDAAASQTGWLAGTPHYMSPEQAQGADLDGRSDLFSLGSVIYFMATGREPFRASQPLSILQKIVSDQPMAAHRINSDVPRQLSRVVDRLLEKKPEDRIQSAQQLCELLESYLAHLQQPQTMSLPRLPVSPRHWRRFGYVAAAIGLFLVVGLGIGSLWRNWKADPGLQQTQASGSEISPQESIASFRALQAELSQGESQAAEVDREIADLARSIQAMEQQLNAVRVTSPSVNVLKDNILKDSVRDEALRLDAELRFIEDKGSSSFDSSIWDKPKLDLPK